MDVDGVLFDPVQSNGPVCVPFFFHYRDYEDEMQCDDLFNVKLVAQYVFNAC